MNADCLWKFRFISKTGWLFFVAASVSFIAYLRREIQIYMFAGCGQSFPRSRNTVFSSLMPISRRRAFAREGWGKNINPVSFMIPRVVFYSYEILARRVVRSRQNIALLRCLILLFIQKRFSWKGSSSALVFKWS